MCLGTTNLKVLAIDGLLLGIYLRVYTHYLGELQLVAVADVVSLDHVLFVAVYLEASARLRLEFDDIVSVTLSTRLFTVCG